MKEEQKLLILEKYLSGQMDRQEQKSFESLLEKDPEWKKLVSSYKIVSDALEYRVEKELKQDLVQWGIDPGLKDKNSLDKKPASLRSWVIGIAATIFIGILGAFWYSWKDYSDKALIVRYYQLPVTSSTRLPLPGEMDAFGQGISAFSNGNWSKAIEYFHRIPPSSPQYDEGQYYLGHAYFNIKQYPSSISVFQALNQRKNIHKEAIDWMIILSLLKDHQDKLVLEKLDDIIGEKNHSYFENALALKKDLVSFWRIL